MKTTVFSMALAGLVLTFLAGPALAIDGVLALDDQSESPIYLRSFAPAAALSTTEIAVYENDPLAAAVDVWFLRSDAQGNPNWTSALEADRDPSATMAGWVDYSLSTTSVEAGERVWVAVQFQAGAAEILEGIGGGPGIGYSLRGEDLADPQLASSDDGATFDAVHPKLELAIALGSVDGTTILAKAFDRNTPGALGKVVLTAQPNPFNPRTMVRFSVRESGPVRIVAYNLRGQRVATLVDDTKSSGEHAIAFEAMDDAGKPLASGVYFLDMRTSTDHRVTRVALVR